MKQLVNPVFFLLPLLLCNYAQAENASKCSVDALDNIEEFAADVRLDLLIDSSCTGVKKEYVKKIFKTKSAVDAEMQFQNQSFCFRKKNGEIVGCHVKKPQRLASVSKIFSMDYLHTYYGETDLSINATLSDQGSLCLENDCLLYTSDAADE